MQDLKETMNKGLADLTKILCEWFHAVPTSIDTEWYALTAADSIASNNTLFVHMSERLVTVEEDTSYLQIKLAEFRRETAEGVADGRKIRLQLQQFQE